MRLDFHKDHRLLFGMVLVGFVGLALVIAVGPALWVNRHNAPLPGSAPLTADEAQGLGVYVSEGCPYCHTQQVRPLPQDRAFGRPSVPADYARLAWLDVWREPPAILGSERTGPDLSDVGNRQPSSTWQYMHLYESRAVVPWSVMPAFPWLFRVEEHPEPGAIVVPVPAPYAPAGRTVVATVPVAGERSRRDGRGRRRACAGRPLRTPRSPHRRRHVRWRNARLGAATLG